MIGNKASRKFYLFNSFLLGVIGEVEDYNNASKDAALETASYKGKFLGDEG